MKLKQALKKALPASLLNLVYGIKWQLNSRGSDSLKMCWPVGPLATSELVAGNVVIRDEAGEEPALGWIDLVNASGIRVTPSTWKIDYVDHKCLGVFVARIGITPAGTAGIRLIEAPGDLSAVLNWVAVHPDHRGTGLAKVLTRLTMERAAQAGVTTVFLATDDFRLPAIRTYLALGFRPCLSSWDGSHPWRWSKIAQQLGIEITCCENCAHTEPIAKLTN